MNMNIFRAYDIRGVFGEDITPETMSKIGMAIGKLMTDKKMGREIVVGSDIRASSPAMSSALVSGLLSTGMNVTDVGTTSFGVALFSGLSLKKDATAYVTASHLPPEWNGVKLYTGEGIPFTEQDIRDIGKLAQDGVAMQDWKNAGKLSRAECTPDYIKFMKDRTKAKRLKIVVDCGNGSTCLSAPHVFEALGFDTKKIFHTVDPAFPNRPSDPAPENISVLREAVVKEGADFGVAFDGDGDRATIVDDKGRALTGNETGNIIGKHLLQNKKGGVIATVACSMAIERELAPRGANVIRVPVGHTFVIYNTKKHDAIFGMEESGHIVLPEYFIFDDGLVVPLKIAQILSERGAKLSALVDESPIYPFGEFVFMCDDDEKFGVVDALKKKLKTEYYRVNDMDGVRVDFDNGWVLIRVSNTSPKIRLYVEADSQKNFDVLKERFSKTLEAAIAEALK